MSAPRSSTARAQRDNSGTHDSGNALRLPLALADAYAVLLRASDRDTLFQETCRILVQRGGVRSATISGLDEASGLLEPLARAGASPGRDSPRRRGLAAVGARRPPRRATRRADPPGTDDAVGFPLGPDGNPVAILHVRLEPPATVAVLALFERLAQALSATLARLEDEHARREAELLRERSASRFRDFAGATGEYHWEVDLQGRFTYVSEGIEALTGHRPDDLLGRTPVEFMPPAERDRVRAWVAVNLAPDGSMRDFEHQMLTTHDTVIWLRVSAIGLFDEHGRRIGQRGSGRDITQRKLAEERAEASSRFLRQLVDTVPDPIVVKDAAGAVLAVNEALCTLYGTSRDDIGGGDLRLPHEAATPDRDADLRVLATRKPVEYEAALTLRGEERWLLVRKSALERRDGSLVVVSVLTDLTQRRQTEQALRESESRFRDFAAAASEFVWETDLEGRFVYVSSRVQSIWGYSESELLGHAPLEFAPPGEPERVREWLERNLQADGSFHDLEQAIVDRNGELRWLLINAVGMFDAQGRRTGQRGAARDITDRKRAEARITHLATRDALTGLPNRLLLNDRLQHALAAARRQPAVVALAFIDLDRFKSINDSLGHDVGDQLLRRVAQRLATCIRDSDTLARLGGDEFVIVLDRLRAAQDAHAVGANILEVLAAPFEIGSHRLVTTASIGISCYPADGGDGAALMRHADIAMYHAKSLGRNTLQFFSEEMNREAQDRHRLESALRQALEARELRLVFQPQITVAGDALVGAEALLRWHHAEMGEVSPARFVPVAEETGLIGPVGDWVIEAACTQLSAWRGLRELRLSVNLSIGQLRDSRAFLDRTRSLIRDAGIDPRALEFEITETLLASNVAEHAQVLRQLGALGCAIAVDDFGTGYSSLSYLKRLPIDAIKIDRSFVRDIVGDTEDAAIVSAIVAMAKKLKLDVVAEGVETAAQLAAVRELGCDRYQGYLFSRPVPAEEFVRRFLSN